MMWIQSGRAAASVMKPANLRNRNDLALFGRFDFPFNRRVSVQGQMRSRFVIVVHVAGDNPSKVTFVENDAMIKALTTNRADESLNIRRLPRRTVCSSHLLDTHVLDSLLEERTVDGVAITNS